MVNTPDAKFAVVPVVVVPVREVKLPPVAVTALPLISPETTRPEVIKPEPNTFKLPEIEVLVKTMLVNKPEVA